MISVAKRLNRFSAVSLSTPGNSGTSSPMPNTSVPVSEAEPEESESDVNAGKKSTNDDQQDDGMI